MDKTDPTGKIAGVDDVAEVEIGLVVVRAVIAAGAVIAATPLVTSIADHIGAAINNMSAKSTAPPVPDKPVGENPRPGRTGGRTVSGPLTPDNGGTGDAEKDFGKLTGGTGKPNTEQGRPPGTQVGDNGNQIRPGPNRRLPRQGHSL